MKKPIREKKPMREKFLFGLSLKVRKNECATITGKEETCRSRAAYGVAAISTNLSQALITYSDLAQNMSIPKKLFFYQNSVEYFYSSLTNKIQ